MKDFEKNLERLEQLTQDIKKSDITLEDALKDFEEGIKLAKDMEKTLDDIEGKVQILMSGKATEETEDIPEQDDKKTTKKRTPKAKKEAEPVLELFTGSTEINGTRNV